MLAGRGPGPCDDNDDDSRGWFHGKGVASRRAQHRQERETVCASEERYPTMGCDDAEAAKRL